MEAARKSIVLLKNKNDFLPLNKKKIKKIAVVGELADIENLGDKGSSRVYPPYVITPLQGIKKEVGNSVKLIFDEGGDPDDIAEIAKDADVIVIVVGFTYKDEGENMTFGGGDREFLTLSHEDEELILTLSKINENCIVVMECGSAIITERWRKHVPAILMAWYPGMEGGTALADILFGNTNPSGKLPIVFPKSLDQLPFFDANTKEIEYGYYHGYRLMDKEEYEPAFPFGFGLSYTSFHYNNLEINSEEIQAGEKVEISVDIKNEGTMRGEEIIQVYVGYPESPIDRPKKELKVFKRIELEQNKSKTISFMMDSKDLAYYNSDKKKWEVEKGTHTVYVGPSSLEQDLLKKTFIIS